jgi:beta-galactosidase GanA
MVPRQRREEAAMGMYQGLYPLGAVFKVQREYGAAEITRTLDDMKRAGMSVAVIWPSVYWWEDRARPGYPYNTGRDILRHADSIGLKIIMETGGQLTALEYAPDFVMKDEYYAVDILGRRETRDIGYGYLNYFHPEVDGLVEKQYGEIAGAYRDFPALYGYDVFNEIMFSSYDRYTLEEFRRWLRNRYGSIEALNDSWDRAYFNWSQVEFTRWLWASVMPLVDYREFLIDAMTGIVARWRGFIRAVDPAHPVIADDLFSMMSYDAANRPQDEWSIAGAVDELGLSYYPKNSVPGFSPPRRAQILNGFHSAALRPGSGGESGNGGGECQDRGNGESGEGRESGEDLKDRDGGRGGRFWVSELQTHFQSIFSPRTVVPLRDLRQWTWECLGAGARGIIYWKWRPFTKGIQTSGRGLVDYRGRFNERTREVQCMAGVIQANADLFNRSVPLAPRAAILYDRLNHSVHRAFLDGYAHLPQNIYQASLEGAFRSLWEAGIPCNVIRPQDLLALEKSDKVKESITAPGPLAGEGAAGSYNTLIVTAQIVMNPGRAGALLAFAERGGRVIIDGKLGVVDERAILNPVVPGGLSRALGFEYQDIDPEGLEFGLTGEDITAAGYYERDYLDILDPNRAQVLGTFRDGRPAVIRSVLGRGEIYYIPSYLWWGCQQGLENGAFVRWLVEKTLARTYQVSGGDLRVQICGTGEGGTEYLVYVYDYSDGGRGGETGFPRAELALGGLGPGDWTARALYTGEESRPRYDGELNLGGTAPGGIRLEIRAGERGVEIYHIVRRSPG